MQATKDKAATGHHVIHYLNIRYGDRHVRNEEGSEFPTLDVIRHALAVNQRAHGAPAAQQVWVRTTLSGDSVRLEWESPGAESVAPWRSGFGLRLVRLCLERQLFGTIERMDPCGMRAVLPLDFVTGSGNLSVPFAARWNNGERQGQSGGALRDRRRESDQT